MENESNGIIIDVIISGYIVDSYRLPNGHICTFLDENRHAYSVWKEDEKPISFKLNAVQIEYFQQQTYPIVEVETKRRNISKLREWWWTGWNDEKIWDVNVKKIGEKTVTMIKTISGKIMYLDQDVSVVEKAINSIV